MLDLNEKVAVITGGSSGIGLGIARSMAKDGAKLVLVGKTPEKIDAAVENVRALGAEVIGIQCDVTQRDEVEALAKQVYDAYGRVDVLVNNAGLGAGGKVHQITDGDWDWVMDVNMRAVFLCCSVFVPRMLDQDGPCAIVNMGSEQCFGLANADFGSMAVYTASKHALLGLSESMRRDYGDTNLSVSIVCPGPVATDIWNAERNRPAAFGEKRPVNPDGGKMMEELGMDPDVVGDMTVAGLKAGDFYIITHGYIRDMIEDRYRETMAALDKTDAWGG